ncbi:hypothetical protein ACSU6B_02130 [Neobacillus sp. C211]
MKGKLFYEKMGYNYCFDSRILGIFSIKYFTTLLDSKDSAIIVNTLSI